MNDITLIDALYCLAPRSGTAEYAKGLLVGVVSGLMGTGKSYNEAIAICSRLAPWRIMANSVPESWINDFKVIDAGGSIWTRSEGR